MNAKQCNSTNLRPMTRADVRLVCDAHALAMPGNSLTTDFAKVLMDDPDCGAIVAFSPRNVVCGYTIYKRMADYLAIILLAGQPRVLDLLLTELINKLGANRRRLVFHVEDDNLPFHKYLASRGFRATEVLDYGAYVFEYLAEAVAT